MSNSFLRHFNRDEFRCPCCGEESMDGYFLVLIDQARELAGVPFVINSGFRCHKHNQEVNGADYSAHLFGLAADIKCIDSNMRFSILNALRAVGINRIGIGSNFIHADAAPQLPQNVIWVY